MINEINNNLQNRDTERNITLFKKSDRYSINFITLSSENGVIRNGGRRGSAFGPQSLLNIFKKIAITNTDQRFNIIECADNSAEIINFDQAQKNETSKIYQSLVDVKAQIHLALGGGHDHIYPYLESIAKRHPNQKLKIINIDPHLDMRIDSLKNSGTPFRQFDNEAKTQHELIQMGTLPYANVESSREKTKNINQKIIYINELKKQTLNFTKNNDFLNQFFPIEKDVTYVLSIDIDCLNSSEMEAVSAVNYDGVSLQFLRDIIKYFKSNLSCQYFGIFEYNPVYDNLSQKGARNIISLIEELL